MSMGHAVDVEVFHGNDTTAFLMGEIGTPESNPFMNTSDGFAMFAPLGCAFGKFGVFPLDFGKHLLFLAEKARIGYLFSIGESSKRFQTYVNAYRVGIFWQAERFYLTAERDIPLTCTTSLNSQGFDLATQGAMQYDFDMPNARSKELALFVDLETRLWVGEAVIAAFACKSWIARVFTGFTASEKCLECQINTNGHILQHLRMHHIQGRTFSFQHRIGGLLPIARH